jgi:glycosyltransferase involved in cell wall biosynthesis
MNILHIVVPCYNEQECLNDSASKLKGVLINLINDNKISKESKIVFVDDGSKDKTWEIIKGLNEFDKTFYGVKLSRNKGHQNAINKLNTEKNGDLS